MRTRLTRRFIKNVIPLLSQIALTCIALQKQRRHAFAQKSLTTIVNLSHMNM